MSDTKEELEIPPWFTRVDTFTAHVALPGDYGVMTIRDPSQGTLSAAQNLPKGISPNIANAKYFMAFYVDGIKGFPNRGEDVNQFVKAISELPSLVWARINTALILMYRAAEQDMPEGN